MLFSPSDAYVMLIRLLETHSIDISFPEFYSMKPQMSFEKWHPVTYSIWKLIQI